MLEQRRYVIDQAGEREAVILSMAEYDRLMEDLRDLALIAERRDDETVSFEDLKAELDSLWTDTA
ncbi:MAG: type II toxin-antitoxin system prevent-host-death family antitoxin [Chloroflexota bacterium]|nr:type II toxin-antitoxin system prevent-host-death family antitoxin [Chloroflexota bacterium]